MAESKRAFYINKFLRGYVNTFTLKEFMLYMEYLESPVTKDEALEVLSSSPYVFHIEKDKYITRAGIFTNKYFSFVLTKEEIENRCFVPGHRCIPFVDQDIISSSITFIYKKQILLKRNANFSKEFALEHFALYGEEYEAQYIANDFGMKDYKLSENNYEIPQTVCFFSVDITNLIDEFSLDTGDRILLKVVDWNECVVEIEPVVREKDLTLELTEEDILRNKWYKKLEKALFELFKEIGPCSSIEEELAYVFYKYGDELTDKNCGSIEEFLKKTKKIGIELFGVETRLWKKGENVPAIGTWNDEIDEVKKGKNENLMYSIPEFVLDEYLKDYAYQKKTQVRDLVKAIFPKSYYIPEQYREELLLHINSRNDIILQSYNWFADKKLGEIRNRALALYTKISFLVYEIDRTGGKFENYPQQELVILIQLYTHLTKLIETISYDSDSIIKDYDTIFVSIEGMEFNFEDIEGELKNAVLECKKNEFTVVK
ncbi:MAG: hypothetical protein J6Y36_06050 [Treponema sp.]|uniref:hypothetical protein n=1 Tax=Treponema sp. TaxID=166 RepID=UPI001B7C7385|nr:hypothetical protein [Treponema sp.]MBP5402705.1 hypothetical protein [Treponema sp.]MBR5933715.1 hypothetical protein [Treponema sp.]